MAKRRNTSGKSDRGYTVGYGKPPKHSRFRPGQSGNPAGRRPGIRNLMMDVKRTLTMPVNVKEAGRMRKKSTQEATLMVMREKALKGDGRSLDRFLELALRFNNDATEAEPTRALSTDDQAILAAYVDECSGAARVPQTVALADEVAATPDSRSKNKRTK